MGEARGLNILGLYLLLGETTQGVRQFQGRKHHKVKNVKERGEKF